MCIHSITEVKCSNSEVVKSYVLAIRNLDNQLCPKWKEGDTEVSVGLKKYYPFTEIVDVSKRYPQDVITCRYLDWIYNYYVDRVAEFHGGARKELEVEVIYRIKANVLKNQTEWYPICERGITFYRKMDRAVSDKNGFFLVKHFRKKSAASTYITALTARNIG